MRKIKAHFFISLDGVVESPDKWHFPYFDEEMGAAVGAGFAGSDAMLIGLVLYEEWAAYWPEHADEPFGEVMNGMKKYVLSSTVTSADWNNAEVVRATSPGSSRRSRPATAATSRCRAAARPCGGCCAAGCSTSSTCSCTPWWSAAGSPGCSPPTSPRPRWSCAARRPSRAAC